MMAGFTSGQCLRFRVISFWGIFRSEGLGFESLRARQSSHPLGTVPILPWVSKSPRQIRPSLQQVELIYLFRRFGISRNVDASVIGWALQSP